MKKNLINTAVFSLLFLITNVTALAQSGPDTVSLVVSGQGATLEEARTNALRSAIEQAYGTFISTKTELLNDSLVKDEVVSVANGNILGYETQAQVSIPGGGYGITLRAMVSLKKLTSFVESKGGSVDIKGGVFAANIKQKLLNEKAELAAVLNICDVSWEILSKSVDFDLQVGENPQLVNKEEQTYSIPIVVKATTNENLGSFYNYLIESLKGLSIKESALESYTESNIKYFTFTYYHPQLKQPEVKIHLRNEQSKFALTSMFLKAPVFYYSFRLISNVDTIQVGKNYPIGDDYYYGRNCCTYNMFFPCRNTLLINASSNDQKKEAACDQLINVECPNGYKDLENRVERRNSVNLNDLFVSVYQTLIEWDYVNKWFLDRKWNTNHLKYVEGTLRDSPREIFNELVYNYNWNNFYIVNRFNPETKKINPSSFYISINKTFNLNELENLNGYRVERFSFWEGELQDPGDSNKGIEENEDE